MMNRSLISATVAIMAFGPVAAEAANARQRGNASGQEARERAATRDLNTQQLAGNNAVSPTQMGNPTSPASTGAMAPAAQSMDAQPMAPEAGSSSPMTPGSETTPPADAQPMTLPATTEPR